MLDWNDLRYFVAVADRGSTLKAGKALRVSQTTVARRLAALEEALGLSLFERRSAGYALTADGESLLRHARQVAASVEQFTQAADSRGRDLSGMVRITSEDIYAMTLIAPLLHELHELHPEIVIDLDAAQTMRDLGEGEADIALRSTSKEQSAGLVGRSLGRDDWTLYCSRGYAERHGAPSTIKQLKKHTIVGGGGGNLWRHYETWLHQLGLEDQVAMHHATSSGLLAAVRSGFGVAALPCIVADADPDLIRCIEPRDDHGRIMWLLTHERVRHTPRIRAVIDFLYERLSRHVRMLADKRAAA